MIQPTVGRVVWFYPDGHAHFVRHDIRQPLAAIISHVWNDRLVNLGGFDSNGDHISVTSIVLLQDDDAKPHGQSFATWMPYQIGQAKRHEAEK